MILLLIFAIVPWVMIAFETPWWCTIIYGIACIIACLYKLFEDDSSRVKYNSFNEELTKLFKGDYIMKDILMTIVRMFVLIVCSVIQIIAALFQIVALATGKVSELLRKLTERLMKIFDRGRYEVDTDMLPTQVE